MTHLEGTPTDDVDGVLALGRAPADYVFVSMAASYGEGADLEHLHWHHFDHRPEQHRLDFVRGSLRLVSTPECRAARSANEDPFDAVDHVMTYLMSDTHGLERFEQLGEELHAVGRLPKLRQLLTRNIYGVYRIDGRAAAPRVKVGADVLPWWPAHGMYVLVEQDAPLPRSLVDVDGVAGAWWGVGADVPERYDSVPEGQQLTFLFLDEDPVIVAERLRPTLKRRWAESGSCALLAAPFQIPLPHDLERHLP